MEKFGFYERVEVDLPHGERRRSGVVRRGAGAEKVTNSAVDVGRVAIGRGDLLVTPLQMAMVASAVANDGKLMTPTLTDRIVDRDGQDGELIEPDRARSMKASTAREVGDMMAAVVREGTGTAAALAGIYVVAGKTGTAERDIEQGTNQPWFIGFAPRENPRIAIAVALENSSGTGGVVAAPIAKQVMEALL